MPSCCCRRSFSFSSLPRLLLLLALVFLHSDGAAAVRPLRGMGVVTAEPPTAPGPAAQLGGGGGGGTRHDRSEAGAEVILAGFAAAVMVVIFCYIRITRKQQSTGAGGPASKQERLGGF